MTQAQLQNLKQRYGIVGNHEALNRALEVALKIAAVDLSVLVTGENGVGKEVFPRIIHDHSARRQKKYFAVNCGAIPEGTIDSELFGHEKGAFTGAIDRREGYFAAADGGTLFLDEVGELPLATQARLLRVLETGEYISVGSSTVRRTDVRIVAATNVDMDRAIARGRFREDLYYRLCAVRIAVPPLRERGMDIDLLFRKFALEMSEKYRMPGPVRLDEEARRLLVSYAWPGNVRQLRNVAENMSVTCDERLITADTLSRYLPQGARRQVVAAGSASPDSEIDGKLGLLYQLFVELRHDVDALKARLDGTGAPRPAARVGLLPGPALVERKERAGFDGELADAEELVEAAAAAADPVSAGVARLDDVEREAIRRALERNRGNRKLAAAEIGMSERTLYRKIKAYGLDK